MLRYLVCALFAVSLLVLAQVAGNGPGVETSATELSRAYAAVRTAWLIPPKDAQAASRVPDMTVGRFAVLAMIAHYSGKTIQQIRAQKEKDGTWAAVVNSIGGDLSEIVFKGSDRYPMTLSLGGGVEGGPGAVERRVGLLAQILTLERLTGDGPGAILQKLVAGRSFRSLLTPTQPQPARPPAGRRDRRRGGRRGPGGPGGLGDRTGPPESHGDIGMGS